MFLLKVDVRIRFKQNLYQQLTLHLLAVTIKNLNKWIWIPSFVLSIVVMNENLQAQNNMHITEQLINGTIRIEAVNDKYTSTGTGFFFTFYYENKGERLPIPTIITNKHVIDGAKKIRLFFKKIKDNEPDYGPPLVYEIPNDSNTVIRHPERDVDLVAIPFGYIEAELSKENIGIYYVATEESRIPNQTQLSELKSIEDVIMIGYPNGLFDEQNNLPIVRRGITATSPSIDYNGKKEFLIDIAAFGGSSGSPVIFYRDIYMDKNYTPKVGTALYLLGVLYAGPQYGVNGQIIKSLPGDTILADKQVHSLIPMNLGFVIKSTKILDFKPIILDRVALELSNAKQQTGVKNH